MANLDIDKVKPQYTQPKVNQETNKPETTTENVPVGKQSEETQRCEALGITREEYVNLGKENPAFLTMPVEEQAKYITEKKNSTQQAQAAEAQTSQTSVAAKTQTSDSAKTEVTNTNAAVPEETKDINGFDKAAFSKMDTIEKYDTCVAELAKNKYMYGDSSAKKSAEDWNNLSDEEKAKIIAETEQIFQKMYIKCDSENARNAFVDALMTETQAANSVKLSVEQFEKLSKGHKEEIVYDYLFDLNERGLASPLDKVRFEEINLLCNAATYIKKQATGDDTKLCPHEAIEYLKEQKIDSITAQDKYLEAAKDNNEELSDYALTRYKELQELKNSVGPDGMACFGTRAGETAKLKTEILSSEKYGAAYQAAKSSEEKAMILASYLKETYGNTENYKEIVNNYRIDAAQCGDIGLAFGLQKMANVDKELAMVYAQDKSREGQTVNSADPNSLGVEAAKVAVQVTENDEDKEFAEANLKRYTRNANGAVAVAVSDVTSGSKYKTVQDATVEMRNRVENSQDQVAITKNIRKNSCLEARKKAVAETGQTNDDVQLKIFDIMIKDAEPAIIKIAAEVPSTLADKNQVKAGEIIYNSALSLDKEDRIEAHNLLADNIIKCKKENQLAMHDILMKSKDDEVLEHASSNIHRYDESVQAEAIKSSYRTGNQKAIDAVNGQIDSCSKKAVEEASKEFNIKQSCAETEARTNKSSAESFADAVINNNKINQNLTEPEAVKGLSETEKTAYYVEYFLKTTDNGRYNMLSKLSDSQLKEVISKLCKYNSGMVKGLVAQGLGKYVLQTLGKSPDVLYSTINIMFQKGGKDAKYAANYIMTNKSLIHFSDNMIEKAEEILGKDNIKVRASHSNKEQEAEKLDENIQYTSNPYGFMKSSLQPRLAARYPNKKEMFYNA